MDLVPENMETSGDSVTHEWFHEVQPILATEEQMADFDKFIRSLEERGILEDGLYRIQTPKSYQDNLRCTPRHKVKNKTVDWVYNMYVTEMKDGYYTFSRYAHKMEEDMVAKTYEAAVKGEMFVTEAASGSKKKKLRLDQPQKLKVKTLMTNYGIPEEFKNKTPQELIQVYFQQLEAAGKKKGRTLFAKYGSDQNDTLFLEGQNPGVFTLDHLDNMIHHVVHHFEYPVCGVTTPMVYYGTWLSTFVKHIEDKNCWSINYLHFGPPKIWFFIKPKDGSKLEAVTFEQIKDVMKASFGHICKAVFKHKLLLVHPRTMRVNGFEVEMAVQYPGDYIVISPGTYHWGFNCGANCAEATNFVTESWIPYGLLSKECTVDNVPKTLDVQFFVMSQWPQKWDDYVKGKLRIKDPITGLSVLVKRPNSKPEVDFDDMMVRMGHVYDFMAAKKVGKTNYVYLALYCIKTWLTQANAERLVWEGTLKPLKFPDFIFDMSVPTVKVFKKVGTVFRHYSGNTQDVTLALLENVHLDFTTLNSIILQGKDKMWVQFGQNRYLMEIITPTNNQNHREVPAFKCFRKNFLK